MGVPWDFREVPLVFREFQGRFSSVPGVFREILRVSRGRKEFTFKIHELKEIKQFPRRAVAFRRASWGSQERFRVFFIGFSGGNPSGEFWEVSGAFQGCSIDQGRSRGFSRLREILSFQGIVVAFQGVYSLISP